MADSAPGFRPARRCNASSRSRGRSRNTRSPSWASERMRHMICLAAAIGVLGIAAMRRAHRCGHGFHGYGWYGPYGGGMRRHGVRRRWMMHALFRRIDATPAQERSIVAELEKLEDRVHGAKAGVH